MAAGQMRVSWVALAGCVPSFGVGMLGIFCASHVNHELLWATSSSSGRCYSTSVGMAWCPPD